MRLLRSRTLPVLGAVLASLCLATLARADHNTGLTFENVRYKSDQTNGLFVQLFDNGQLDHIYTANGIVTFCLDLHNQTDPAVDPIATNLAIDFSGMGAADIQSGGGALAGSNGHFSLPVSVPLGLNPNYCFDVVFGPVDSNGWRFKGGGMHVDIDGFHKTWEDPETGQFTDGHRFQMEVFGAVPEPGEWAAMGVLAGGLGGLVIRARRRRA